MSCRLKAAAGSSSDSELLAFTQVRHNGGHVFHLGLVTCLLAGELLQTKHSSQLLLRLAQPKVLCHMLPP